MQSFVFRGSAVFVSLCVRLSDAQTSTWSGLRCAHAHGGIEHAKTRKPYLHIMMVGMAIAVGCNDVQK